MNWFSEFALYLGKKMLEALIQGLAAALVVFWVAGWLIFLPLQLPQLPIPTWLIVVLEIYFIVPMIILIFGYLAHQYDKFQKEFQQRENR